MGIYELSSGGIDGVTVDQRAIFAAALKANATQIILAHNHPSGNLKPSRNDIQTTKRLVECGHIMGIKVIKHLIITVDGYSSMCDEGLM
ncbi:JAB domain-containing protein [Olivibacter sitiensis]|uniref:JAB domain-containing protein n=1 Tax=Olivibacter sitiensis TaxID=376470 RepID=UPI0003FABA92|nr:JAB domain-containing protein [Olivibacter sitiensis]